MILKQDHRVIDILWYRNCYFYLAFITPLLVTIMFYTCWS